MPILENEVPESTPSTSASGVDIELSGVERKRLTHNNLDADDACVLDLFDDFVVENGVPPTIAEVYAFYPDWIIWLNENDYYLDGLNAVINTVHGIYTFTAGKLVSKLIGTLLVSYTYSSIDTLEPEETEGGGGA